MSEKENVRCRYGEQQSGPQAAWIPPSCVRLSKMGWESPQALVFSTQTVQDAAAQMDAPRTCLQQR